MVDTRPISMHATRVALLQQLYSSFFNNTSQPLESYSGMTFDYAEVTQLYNEIVDKTERMDALLQNFVKFDVSAINHLEHSILLMGTLELLSEKIEFNIVLQEAINLANEFGSSTSYKFINGVLSAVARHLWDEGLRFENTKNRPL